MQKQQVLTNPSLSFDDKNSLKFLLGVEELCGQDKLVQALISHYFVNDDKPNPIVESTLELKFEKIDRKNFNNSILKSAIWRVTPIEDFFPGEIIVNPVGLIDSGLLEQWAELIFSHFPEDLATQSLSMVQFDEYVIEHGIRNTLTALHEQSLSLNFPIDVAFMKVLVNNPVHMDEITKFIKSEFFTEECSSLIVQKEYYIISDIDILRELFSYNISEASQWTLISRFKKENPTFPSVYSVEELETMVQHVDSYAEFKEKLFIKKLIFSNENLTPKKYIDLDFSQVPMEDALIAFMESREVSDQEITSYIFRPNASPKISQIIINKSDYLITDPILYLKVEQSPILSEDAKKVISERYEGWFSKDKQKQFAIEFQSYDSGVIPIPGESAEISNLIEKSKVLYSLVPNIAPEVTQGIVKNLPYVDGEYDSAGFPLVAEYKISRVLMTALRNQKAPSDFVMYIHNCSYINEEFKIKEIIAHPSCPNSLIDSYIEQHNLYSFLLKNPALSQEHLLKMVTNLKDVGAEEVIYKAILNHPNCPSELKVIIQEGVVGYFNKIKDSEDATWLAEQVRLLIQYPSYWNQPRLELSIKDKHQAIALTLKNFNTPTFAIEQLLAFYSSIETAESEPSTACRQLFLIRKDCPKKMLWEMINYGRPKIRLEVIHSNHFNDEDLISAALNVAFLAHLESLGDVNGASSKVLYSELSGELKEIISSSPIPEQTRGKLKQKILSQLNDDLNKKDPSLNKNIIKFFKSNELIAGIIVILEEEKRKILDLMKQAYGIS